MDVLFGFSRIRGEKRSVGVLRMVFGDKRVFGFNCVVYEGIDSVCGG